MKFRTAYIILFFILLIIPFGVFLFIEGDENQATFVAISGVASFLFGLLATYTLKDRHVRLGKIVENASIERGEIVFIYECMKAFPVRDQKRILLRVDEYMMAQLDLEVRYFHRTDEQFKALMDDVRDLPLKTERQGKLYDRMISAIEKIENTRKYSATLFEDRVTKTEWVILYFLILLIYTSLLFANTGGALALAVIIGLAFVISYVIVVSYKLDQMRWKIDEKIFEPYQQTLETIGLLRYYPKPLIDRHEINRLYRMPAGTKFRVGDLPDYPSLVGRTIETREL